MARLFAVLFRNTPPTLTDDCSSFILCDVSVSIPCVSVRDLDDLGRRCSSAGDALAIRKRDYNRLVLSWPQKLALLERHLYLSRSQHSNRALQT